MTTIHDLKPEKMTPDERNKLAIDWIQDNAPDYVMQYLDQDANASHLYIISLEMGLDDLEKQVERLEAERDALRTERKQIAAALGIKAETYDLLDFARATVAHLDARNEAIEIVIAENDALRAAYAIAAAIMRSQPVGVPPRLVQAWREAQQAVENATR